MIIGYNPLKIYDYDFLSNLSCIKGLLVVYKSILNFASTSLGRLNGVAESSSFKLRSANKVVCCDRELPTLSLIANGKVKKVVYADALVVGMEEFVLHAQHPSFGREYIQFKKMFPVGCRVGREFGSREVLLLVNVHIRLTLNRKKSRWTQLVVERNDGCVHTCVIHNARHKLIIICDVV